MKPRPSSSPPPPTSIIEVEEDRWKDPEQGTGRPPLFPKILFPFSPDKLCSPSIDPSIHRSIHLPTKDRIFSLGISLPARPITPFRLMLPEGSVPGSPPPPSQTLILRFPASESRESPFVSLPFRIGGRERGASASGGRGSIDSARSPLNLVSFEEKGEILAFRASRAERGRRSMKWGHSRSHTRARGVRRASRNLHLH